MVHEVIHEKFDAVSVGEEAPPEFPDGKVDEILPISGFLRFGTTRIAPISPGVIVRCDGSRSRKQRGR